MCGIAGFCNRQKTWREDIERMKQRLISRGPDAEGSWADESGDVALGHRRLSILDLSPAGAQPMVSHSGRYVLSYNGEIYNSGEVARQLRAEGKLGPLRGSSDTEVLLEALESWGVKEGLRACKGMFALALYDRREKRLWLARDRVGEKPLYYGFVGKSFVFASELGAIAALPDFDGQIDRDVLDIYMVHGYIPAPYSIYRGIRKLEPGTILRIDSPYREYSLETYWSMAEVARRGQENLFQGSRQEASEELERLLTASVRGQMVSDVPLGAFLSAGIDSSTVVSLMQSVSEKRVKTFTIGMEDAAYDEADAAAKIAEHLGTEHTRLTITERDARAVIPLLPAMFGEPFADSSQIPTYLVSRLTREHVTVSLSGDGGDELFCGYGTYRSIANAWEKLRRIPLPLRQAAGKALTLGPLGEKEKNQIRAMLLSAGTPEELYACSDLSEPFLGKLTAVPGRASCVFDTYESGFLPGVQNNLMLMDLLMYHPDDILVKVDRTAMAVSLESRVPMLDRDVVEFAWRLPLSMKWEAGQGKLVLRDVLYRHVPRELMERPKKGFSIPVGKWLREPELNAWAQDLLAEERICREGYFDPAGVKRLWTDYTERGIWRKQIWHLLQFESWNSSASRKQGEPYGNEGKNLRHRDGV
ncbi:MAG: asparagine synthase (glutamine-hydrolyzing) [Eubacteriales bacterium]|nr:asparagine synthase (glutamine-hydrolyzing) [Eubacteriales bacterium]